MFKSGEASPPLSLSLPRSLSLLLSILISFDRIWSQIALASIVHD